MKNSGHTVKYLCSNNAGKQQTIMAEICGKYTDEMEHTAPYTP